MPFSIHVETNFQRWAKRRLKRITGELVLGSFFVIAIPYEVVVGVLRSIAMAYYDWQKMRAHLNYRKWPE